MEDKELNPIVSQDEEGTETPETPEAPAEETSEEVSE